MRRFLLALVSTVASLVALLSFKTHDVSSARAPAAITASLDPAAASGSTPAGSSSTVPTPATGSTGGATSTSTPSSGSATTTKTVTGSSIDTRWGPVQVRITVTGSTLTAVTAIVYPSENPRDQEINSSAVPELNKEALAAGSAKIDMVSGATYTSTGYIGSLQSALDRAGL